MAEFPAMNYLGYGLDLTTLTPFDIRAVVEGVRGGYSTIQVYRDETRNVKIGDVEYKVPYLVAVTQDVQSLDGSYVTYRTGTEATTSFQADSSLSVRYHAVSAGASASYATSKSFRSDRQFAMYSFNMIHYGASLRNYFGFFNETALLNWLPDLRAPFPQVPGDGDLKNYRSFFEAFGSHIITGATYGARFQLNVWASNSNSSVNNRFSVSVKAAFNGIMAGGEFDANVKKEEQFDTFEEYMQRTLTVQGGNQELAVTIMNQPQDYSNYTQWTRTSLERPNIMGFQTIELWTLMRGAANSTVRGRANDIQAAYNYIVSRPQVYTTPVRLTVQSDWGEFGLLTPSATIVRRNNVTLPARTRLSQTKVTFGEERSHNYQRESIDFDILNDGSPVDFYLSHGSNGSGGGNGLAMITMAGHTHTNDEINDNNWNTMWFYRRPVAAGATPSRWTLDRNARTWDETLQGYLADIGYHHTKAEDELVEGSSEA